MIPRTFLLIPLLACSAATAAEPGPPPPPDATRLAASLVERGDQNSDGLLTLAELTAAFQAMRPDQGARPGGIATPRDAMTGKHPRPAPPGQGDDQRPPDGDGHHPPPPPLNTEQLAALFTTADADGNGTLDRTELAGLLKVLGRQRGGGHRRPPPSSDDGAVPGQETATRPHANGF